MAKVTLTSILVLDREGILICDGSEPWEKPTESKIKDFADQRGWQIESFSSFPSMGIDVTCAHLSNGHVIMMWPSTIYF